MKKKEKRPHKIQSVVKVLGHHEFPLLPAEELKWKNFQQFLSPRKNWFYQKKKGFTAFDRFTIFQSSLLQFQRRRGPVCVSEPKHDK